MVKTVKVPDELYEKLKEMADSQGKAIHEVISGLLERIEVGEVQIKLPKPKFIPLRYPAYCVLGNHKIDPEEYRKNTGRIPYALWFPELGGVICIDCLIKEVFTKEEQAKVLTKLEVEIRKLRAIKRQLNKEVEELAMQYSVAEIFARLDSIINEINEALKLVRSLEDYIWCKEEECEEKKKVVLEAMEKIDGIKEQLEKLELPESWAKKLIKKAASESYTSTSYSSYRRRRWGSMGWKRLKERAIKSRVIKTTHRLVDGSLKEYQRINYYFQMYFSIPEWWLKEETKRYEILQVEKARSFLVLPQDITLEELESLRREISSLIRKARRGKQIFATNARKRKESARGG
ncbi:hypothetical putative RHH DNA-binding protein [Alphaspiravirus yamagawaense]|uniref:Hypothetical putative RHH DNA-binding protein n=1 Tax=Alphaspiravirus yamagawaense TaxID=1157339 RepID=J7Q7J3_9VIRU|nr:hypothetical putative RHH DNA-binding protein [Aeropyrum coil-shaped virus]CCG27842.1 hypothetical putative RHH DNA-binding protein [Aeropyrum coil-shaped virus]